MIKNIKKLIEYSKEGIISKKIFIKDNLDISLFCMAKKTKISEHSSTKQGFIYIIEGKGIFNLKGKEIQMLPGVFIYMDKNAIHSLKANENTSFILYLFEK